MIPEELMVALVLTFQTFEESVAFHILVIKIP